MNPWLVAQIVYASTAWWFCARAIMRASTFQALAGRELAATIRELRKSGRVADVPRLAQVLESETLLHLLDIDLDNASAEQIVSEAGVVSRLVAPPVRVLRSLATLGTMLGLLAAVASLHTGLDSSSSAALQSAAGRAFDSAVVGFVTALPCWTAAALCGRIARQTDIELEAVLLALTAEGKGAATMSLPE